MKKRKIIIARNPILPEPKPEVDQMMCQACNEGVHPECLGFALIGRDVGCACEECFFG